MSDVLTSDKQQVRQRKQWWKSFTAATLMIAPLLAICIASYDAQVVAWFAQRDLPGDVEKTLQLSEAFAHGGGVMRYSLHC